MPRLIVQDPNDRRETRLDRGRVRLGRDPDSELVLEDDGVSRNHAVLTRERGVWVIEDAGSRNGTFVNDERIQKRVLEDGDRVRLGGHLELEYRDDDAHREPRGKDAAVSGGRVTTSFEVADESWDDSSAGHDGDDSQTGVDTTRSPRGRARSRGGAAGWLRERRFVLLPADGEAPIPIRSAVTTVGRDANAGVQIEDASVSRMHARLDRDGDALLVTDLKSRNGLHVNDERVMRARLEHGDRVQFGDVEFELAAVSGWAWGRVATLAIALVVLIAGAVGVLRIGDWLGEKADVAAAERQLKARALASLRQGIEAYRRDDLDYARGYLLYAGDVLLLSGLAPPGASLSRPNELFRGLARDLPPDERDVDFAKVLDPDAIAVQHARLEGLSNREYVERQIKRIAIELGQDEDVPAGFVDQVWSFVEAASRNPGWFQEILDRSPRYHPRLRQILAEAHLPEVFCYVAWIESGLRPGITSPAGARGTWQFMPGTAQQYGLRVDPGRGIDERTDFVKSSRAATMYVGNLIRTFGREQFMCALASYNRGESAVRRAMEKIPDPMMPSARKYWYLVENGFLPRETSEYVPKIIGARILAEDPERFGLRRPGT